MDIFNKHQDFFKFAEQPFKKTPATKNYFENKSLAGLLEAFQSFIKSDSTFATLTGAEGVGKTSFANRLISKTADSAKFIYMQFPFVTADEILQKLLTELKPKDENSALQNNRAEVVNEEQSSEYQKLNNYLVQTTKSGRKIVFIVDETQSLTLSTFEVLKVLSNQIYDDKHLIKIILIGDLKLPTILEKSALSDIAKNITLSAKLDNLPQEDVDKYIKSEIAFAGSKKIHLSLPLIKKIAKLSSGNPKLINTYIERAITTAAVQSATHVTIKHLTTGLNSFNYIVDRGTKYTLIKQVLVDIVFVLVMFVILQISYSHAVKYGVLDSIKERFTSPLKTENIATPTAIATEDNISIKPITDNKTTAPIETVKKENIVIKVEEPKTEKSPVVEKVEPKPAPKELDAIIAARSLNVRSEPDSTAQILGAFKDGDAVKVIDLENGWVSVKIKGKTGYMMKTYLDILE